MGEIDKKKKKTTLTKVREGGRLFFFFLSCESPKKDIFAEKHISQILLL